MILTCIPGRFGAGHVTMRRLTTSQEQKERKTPNTFFFFLVFSICCTSSNMIGGPASSSEEAGMELTDSVELEELERRPFLAFLWTPAVAMMICLFIAVGTS